MDAFSPKALAMQFESLGHDCEFGLVQRAVGAEPLGLMRFTAHSFDDLRRALQSRFDYLTNNVALYSNPGGEYITHARDIGFHFHTFQWIGQVDPDILLSKEIKRLGFLRRKILEDLSTREKIFVRRANDNDNEDAEALASDLQGYGPNTLLWVQQPDASHESGTVIDEGGGLIRGYLDHRPADENTFVVDRNAWIKLCRRASRLRDQIYDDIDMPPTGPCKIVRATNGLWVGDLELAQNGRMRHIQHKSLGSYYQREDVLHALWDIYDSELFLERDGVFRSIQTLLP